MAFDLSVTSQKTKEYAYEEMSNEFAKRLFKRKEYFKNNADIISAFDFMKKVVDFFHESTYNNSVEQKQ